MSRPTPTRSRVLTGVAVVVAVLVALTLSRTVGSGDSSHDGPNPSAATATATEPGSPGGTSSAGGLVDESRLPAEARATILLIDAGGPFPYERDGIVFENRERLLPSEPTGYYHEYTVPTPGEEDRGARRLVSGADGRLWWTADHYASFAQVRRD